MNKVALFALISLCTVSVVSGMDKHNKFSTSGNWKDSVGMSAQAAIIAVTMQESPEKAELPKKQTRTKPASSRKLFDASSELPGQQK